MRTRLIVLVELLAVVVAIPSPGMANVITRRDGNDTRGPLDLAAVQVSHTRGGHVFKMTTLAPFTNAEANGKNGSFEIAIDTNADRRPNAFIDVFYAAGRFRGVLFKPNGAVYTYRLKAARVSPRAVKVELPSGWIRFRTKGSYDFAALSFYVASPCTEKNPCVDIIPNKFPLIRHDFTAPTITWGSVPRYSTDASATLTFPISFSVRDDVYGSGVKSWTLQQRAVGTSSWVAVQTGTALNPTVQVTGEEGTTYDLRIVAVDRQANERTSSLQRTNVPYDDRNSILSYSSSVQNDSVSDAFLGTTSSVPQNGTIAFTVPADASSFCIVGGPTTGPIADVEFAFGGGFVDLTEDGNTPARQNLGCWSFSDGPVSGIVTSAEPFVLDGIILVP